MVKRSFELFEDGNDTDSSEEEKKKKGRKEKNKYVTLKPFKCTRFKDGIKCTSRFSSKRDLHRHTKGVHENNGFPCSWPDCDLVLSSKQAVKRHVKAMHLDEHDSHACDQCQNTFKTATGLLEHKRKIHSAKCFKCPNCESYFESEDAVGRHLLSYHDDYLVKQDNVNNEVGGDNKSETLDPFSQGTNFETASYHSSFDSKNLQKANDDAKGNGDSVAMIVTVYRSELYPKFRHNKISIVDFKGGGPNFEDVTKGFSSELSGRGEKLSAHKITKDISKSKSCYFPAGGRQNAEAARGLISILLAYFESIRHSMSDMNPEFAKAIKDTPEHTDQIKIDGISEDLLREMLRANNLDLVFEAEDEFKKRSKSSKENVGSSHGFNKYRYPSFMSDTKTNFGYVYMRLARVDGKLYIYIGQRQQKGAASRGGRVSSETHRLKSRGSMATFKRKYPEAEVHEKLLFYLTEESTGVNPLGEYAAIMAFFFLQYNELNSPSTGSREKFTLINSHVIYPPWSQDFLDAVRLLIFQYSGRRFKLLPKFKKPPLFPNVETILTKLGAKPFDA